MKEKNYKLIGSICLFDNNPEFVYPVFENDGKFYFEHCEVTTVIDGFVEIKDEKHKALIQPFNEQDIISSRKREYNIGDSAVIGFRQDNLHTFFGSMDEFKKFLKTYSVTDPILLHQIKSLMDEDKKRKQYQKKFIRKQETN